MRDQALQVSEIKVSQEEGIALGLLCLVCQGSTQRPVWLKCREGRDSTRRNGLAGTGTLSIGQGHGVMQRASHKALKLEQKAFGAKRGIDLTPFFNH